MDYANMSLWKKIQLVKQKLLESNLIQTGENTYAGFKYYELGDFIPTIISLCNEVGLFTKVTFTNEFATLTIINSDKQDQKEEYTSPMRELELKGCNKIQALGGIETYSRRYLYMAAFDITENDMFDPTTNKKVENTQVTQKPEQQDKVVRITPGQIKNIKSIFTDDEITKALNLIKRKRLEDMTLQEASSLIRSKKKVEVTA